MGELISVIIPVYRVEEYLRRCVDSVLSQDYGNFEVILVDDGSDDGCPVICDRYAQSDPRVSVIHQENKGLSGARNAGIDASHGLWLSFIDSDDYVAPDFLSRLYKACVDTGSDIGVCRWEYVHGENIPAGGTGGLEVKTGREMLGRLYDPDGAYFVVAWNKLYRRELYGHIRYPQGRIHEDEATTYLLYDIAVRAVYLDVSLYGYFVAPKSITRGFNPKRTDWISAQKERIDYFEERCYDELMVPALKAASDGGIDIWFGFKDNLPDAKEQMDDIKAFVKNTLVKVKRYGNFSLKTAIGYRLFIYCPGLYRRLLDRVKAENGKQ